jgi:hypothetical protein
MIEIQLFPGPGGFQLFFFKESMKHKHFVKLL